MDKIYGYIKHSSQASICKQEGEVNCAGPMQSTMKKSIHFESESSNTSKANQPYQRPKPNLLSHDWKPHPMLICPCPYTGTMLKFVWKREWIPSRQFWDCGRWKSDSLWEFSIDGLSMDCQLSTGLENYLPSNVHVSYVCIENLTFTCTASKECNCVFIVVIFRKYFLSILVLVTYDQKNT